MLLVDLVAIQVDAESGASVLVLREHDAPHRLLPIAVGGDAAASIAIAASGNRAPRPLTHDLLAALVESFEGHLDAVEVTDFRDGTFFADLALSGPIGPRRIDTRPSDAIALAVRLHAPLYVSEHVLAEAGALPVPDVDPEAIDAEVAEFHEFLDHLEPADFLDPAEPGGGPSDGPANPPDPGDGPSGRDVRGDDPPAA
ncbi:MAG TPA: bifunctional nuclease family protein [Ilumatobacter sp.]